MTNPTINLDVLNRLVKELNDQVKQCNELDPTDKPTMVAALAKALGYATGITLEAAALVKVDLTKAIDIVSSPAPQQSIVDELLGQYGGFGGKITKN